MMTRFTRLLPSLHRPGLLGGLALMLAFGTQAETVLPPFEPDLLVPFEARYDVGNNLISAGTAILSLTEQDGLWRYSLRTRPQGVFKLTGKGKIRETSIFQLDNDSTYGIRPLNYHYRQDSEDRRSVDATFDWEEQSLQYLYRGKTQNDSMESPILDRMSVTLLIMNTLRQGFAEAEVTVFDSGRLKTLKFVNEGEERIDTERGPVDTVRVRSQNVDSNRRQTVTWFAPALDYIPIRIEQLKRGDLVARLKLESYSPSERPGE